MRDRSHDDSMAEIYRDDPAYARLMLNTILEDEEATLGELMVALRQMAKAFGGVQSIAEKAELNPTQIYRTLSADGNPSLSSFTAILKAMGMQLVVKAVDESAAKRKKPARTQGAAAGKVKAAR